ncbi:MAG TPA: Ig-like domain-containing protein [Gemmatimonadales bacterium]|nr:Ig-like domain-containing protein [Gemmatimonadales bacterium]
MRRAAVLIAGLAACARIAAPPGGPPDNRPPLLLGTTPESLVVVADFEGPVEFRFNEVVSEGGQPNFGLGTGDLERLVVLSPTTEVPSIGWHRDRITVKPREGWQPNRIYRVELLAGVRDLRNNTGRSSTVVTFSTGAPIPTDSLIGLVVDWSNLRPARNALVEAVLQPDSLVYRTQADSTGRFHFAPLPAGEYVVYGVLDANRNNKRDLRESFDSLRIPASQSLVGELWMFRHDTTEAKIQTASTSDSVTASLSFTGPLDPYQRLPRDSAVVRVLPDSTPVAVEFVLPKLVFDSLMQARREADDSAKRAAQPDSARAARPDSVPPPARDTTRRAPADTAGPRIVGVPRQVTGARKPVQDTTLNQPLKTKPPLFDQLVVRLTERWRDSTRYLIEIHGVRTVSGKPGTARTILTVPPRPPPKPDSAAVADSLKPPVDTTRRDTLGVTLRRHVLPSLRRG